MKMMMMRREGCFTGRRGEGDNVSRMVNKKKKRGRAGGRMNLKVTRQEGRRRA